MERGAGDELRQQLAALADGDREAFHPVFVRLWPLLRRFAARHLPAAEAEDAAQQALMKLFCRVTEYDPARQALPWALGIAANEIRTARRKAFRRREDPLDVGALTGRSATRSSPEDELVARDLDLALDAALRTMSASDAQTLLSYAHGDRPPLAPATFRKRVQRALARLRAAWRRTHGAE